MPILAKREIWYPNLKIGLCTILRKAKVKVLDTYEVIANSPKQFDPHVKGQGHRDGTLGFIGKN